jgi:hypothetical protein
VEQHQRQQPEHLGLVGKQAREQPAQADRLGGEVRARERLAARGEVPLVEDDVDRREHHRDPIVERVGRGNGDRDRRLADLALRARETLRDRGLRLEERSGDLARREAAERSQDQRHLHLARERGMAAREHQRESIVRIFVHGMASAPVARFTGRALRVCLEHRELVGVAATSPEAVDRAVPRGRRDPRAGIVGGAVRGPALERDGERLLHGLLGHVQVADGAGDGRDRPCGLEPEQAVDDVGRIAR